MKELNDFEKGWISAAIDGEGCIALNKVINRNRWGREPYRFRPRLYIGNNCYEFVLRCQEICGMGTIRKQIKNGKPSYLFRLASNGIKELLTVIYPFLLNKRRHAELILKAIDVLEARELYGARHDFDALDESYSELQEICEKIKVLNGRRINELKN